ncbi:DUF7249 family protein [Paraburkholderia sp. HD33-4]|uniref:DUF7249 family protein n=1 Tax=Paraburkholderia sp. HD33-4 TaxID=2883242 RepID=UPI001F46EB24|nr:hypothetical protein [Paraburkholderia sp. HD33-4]
MTGQYNGWTNYATWCVHRWMTGDQGTWRYTLETIADMRALGNSTGAALVDELADYLKADHMESVPEQVTGVWRDLITRSLGDVDWREIAEKLLEN